MTEDFEYFRQLCLDLTGNSLETDKSYLIEGRLAALAEREEAASVTALVSRLRRSPVGSLHWEAVEAATTKETFFFRDDALFTLLEQQVLDEVVGSRRAARTLRIWSAACSRGQEPYSIAMLLWDACPETRSWDVQVLGSDIASSSLAEAREGVYTRFEVARGLSEERLQRHFEPGPRGWVVSSAIRSLVRFERINLAKAWPALDVFDMVFLRNVLLYFNAPLRRTIMEKLHNILAPSGYLFLGASENLLHDEDLFVPFVSGRTIGFRPVSP